MQKNNRRVITMTPRPAAPEKMLWSHQQELSALKGKEVTIRMNDGSTIQGILNDADQFTLKVTQGSSMLSPVVLFKSAVTYFRVFA